MLRPKNVLSVLAVPVVSVLMLVATAVSAQEKDLPSVVSADLRQVNSHTFPQIAASNQSGERLIVSAVLFNQGKEVPSDEDESEVLSRQFVFGVPAAKASGRICVDMSERKGAFRKMALLEPVKPTSQISAHIEADSTRQLQGGAMVVAYPVGALGEGTDNPLKACLLQSSWIYPAQIPGGKHGRQILQLRINTGGGDANVAQMKEGAPIREALPCVRDESEFGLYNRVCRLVLAEDAHESVRIKLIVTQRNAAPIRMEFNIALADAG